MDKRRRRLALGLALLPAPFALAGVLLGWNPYIVLELVLMGLALIATYIVAVSRG